MKIACGAPETSGSRRRRLGTVTSASRRLHPHRRWGAGVGDEGPNKPSELRPFRAKIRTLRGFEIPKPPSSNWSAVAPRPYEIYGPAGMHPIDPLSDSRHFARRSARRFSVASVCHHGSELSPVEPSVYHAIRAPRGGFLWENQVRVLLYQL